MSPFLENMNIGLDNCTYTLNQVRKLILYLTKAIGNGHTFREKMETFINKVALSNALNA